MPAFCPHCNEALSAYTTNAESKPTNVEVLVCGHCDKVLGVVGPARAEGPGLDVDEIADLLSVAASTDDEGEAQTVFSVAIGKIDSAIEEEGGGGIDGRLFERLLKNFFDRLRDEKRRREQQDADRPPPG